MRIKDLEFRKTKAYGPNPYEYYEIVKWYQRENEEKEYCYTLLQYKNDSEGPDIRFVGGRPFNDEIDQNVLWELMKYGQTVTQAEFDLIANTKVDII